MNTLESQIIAKFHQAILAAEPAEMGGVIDKLKDFFGVIEKRVSLVTTEVKNVVGMVQTGL